MPIDDQDAIRAAQQAALTQWRDANGLRQLTDSDIKQLCGVPVNPAKVTAIIRRRVLGGRDQEIVQILTEAAGDKSAASGEPTPMGSSASSRPLVPPQPARPAAQAASSITAAPSAGHLAHFTQPEALEDLLHDFASVDFSAVDSGERATFRGRSTPQGITLRWANLPTAEPYSVFRLVSGEGCVPYSPDSAEAEVLAITKQLTFDDPRPATTAVRHYQVWRNSGADHDAALWEQPELIAEFSLVFPPQELRIQERGHQVVGQWRMLPGTERVHVYRVPQSQARTAGAGNPGFRIATVESGGGGFVDTDVEPGETYVYQVIAEASTGGGSQLAAPLTEQLSISATAKPISDLQCVLTHDGDRPTIDLSWTSQERGTTRIYCTSQRPTSGSERTAQPVAQLDHLGLPYEDVLAHPIDIDGDRSRMQRVGWPRGWGRAYFTPVHIVGDEARLGTTVLQVLPPRVTDVAIHQRVDYQTLTLTWPVQDSVGRDSHTRVRSLAADRVGVYQAHVDVPEQAAISGTPLVTLSKQDYDRYGGVIFPQPLRPEGSMIYAVPYAHAGADVIQGIPGSVRYPGLLRIQATLRISRRSLFKSGWTGRIAFIADRDSPSPAFCVVHLPDRLPLAVEDGRQLAVTRAGVENDTPVKRFQPSALGPVPSDTFTVEIDQPGYVRIFALVHPDRRAMVALIDPPVGEMRCGK